MQDRPLFGRRYQLIVGNAARRILDVNAVDTFTGNVVPGGEGFNRAASKNRLSQFAPEVSKFFPKDHVEEIVDGTDDFIEITDLHIEAEIIKNKAKDGKETVPAMIRVYNASPSTRAKLEAGSVVMLKAGYQTEVDSVTNLPRLFLGTIFQSETKKEGKHVITTIYAHNALEPRKYLRVSKSWPSGTRYSEILEDVASIIRDAGVTVELKRPQDFENVAPSVVVTEELDNTSQFISTTYNTLAGVRGQYLYGDIWEFLRQICAAIKYRYYFIDDVLYIEPLFLPAGYRVKTYTLTATDVRGSVKKRSTTGLYGVPDKKVTGVLLNLWLNPAVKPSERINLTEVFDEYNDYSGTYQVVGVKHVLQFEGQDWYTEVEAQRISDATQ